MSGIVTVIDWVVVPRTQAAQNLKNPAHALCVIAVPRALIERTWLGGEWEQFAALEETCARGGEQLEPSVIAQMDAPAPGFAFIRCGDSTDKGLRGRSLLFRQGWNAFTPKELA